MKIKATLAMLFILTVFILMPSTISRSATGTVADLPPQLRDALLRDVACQVSTRPASTTPTDAPEVSNPDLARVRLLETQIDIQEIHSAAGGPGGVIATPQGGCACTGSSCLAYVYLKNGQAYRLGFKGEFTLLHPMKVYKRGMPSLTGKLQISDTQAETTVYDWNGQGYEASLCATVTQGRNQRLPTIARHECGKVH